ncbi:MAG: ribonuclease J [Candidatus Saccharimonadales bacterium]
MSEENKKNNNNNQNRNRGRNRRPQNQSSANSKPHNSRRNARAAEREVRRNQDDAHRNALFDDVVTDADRARLAMRQKQANQLDEGTPKLKVTPLGGQDEVGNNNMNVIEYGDDAIVVDCGFALGLDLPGINYGIPDITYLESIKHKVRGYVFTHGHLDHIGATPFVIPKIPAPVYGSTFTVGMVEKQIKDSDLELDFVPETVAMNIDNHEKLKVGPFFIELVRVTHSIPDCTAVVIDTPVGRIIHTGDFRLDPEPLDHHPSDISRLEELGREGVLLLMAESTNTESPGRTETEHTLEKSFHDILHQSSGRVLVSTFSSNINRMQMIINASVESGRRVAIDGRSMLATVELAFKLGYMKIPQGTIVAMKDIANVDDREVTIICTGSQGEPNAALQRMSYGDHNHIKLKEGDTVILSSNPIPGNEVAVAKNVDRLMRLGASVYRHRTHELDGCGPLHVSGHGNRDELKQMIEMTKPKYIMPNHGPYFHRQRYVSIAESAGYTREQVVLIDNGDVLEFNDSGQLNRDGHVPAGTVLVDQTGSVVPNLVIKDRLLMGEDGIVVVVLTVDKQSKQMLSSPDIISRGFIHMQEQGELLDGLRNQLRDFTKQQIRRSDLKVFKQNLRDEVSGFLFNETGKAPMVIPVVNLVGGGGKSQSRPNGGGRNRHRGNTPPNGQSGQAKPSQAKAPNSNQQ